MPCLLGFELEFWPRWLGFELEDELGSELLGFRHGGCSVEPGFGPGFDGVHESEKLVAINNLIKTYCIGLAEKSADQKNGDQDKTELHF